MWFLLACTSPTPAEPEQIWLPPTQSGSWSVGVRTETLDAARGELTAEIWYPAQFSDSPARYDLPYEPESIAHRDAEPRTGSFPVVVFSHGLGGSRHQSVFLTERLASHGFTVVAVDHPFSTLFDLDQDRLAEVAGRRPDDIRQALDGFDTAPGVAMIGHSFGAWTSLVVGGGRIDLAAGEAYCQSHDPAGCNIVGAVDDTVGSLEPDPRIEATVLLAPGGWYSFADLSEVHPVLMVSGDEDEDLPYEEEQHPTFERLGSPKSQLLLHDAGHFGFTDACNLVPLADCAGAVDGWMEPERVQELTASVVTAFLGVELLDDPRYAPFLVGADDASWTGP